MALELRHLRFLLAAADQGSFGRAAKAVGVGQPAFSRAIQDLENEIGGSLFERDHAGVRPTLAGGQFIDRVRPLLDGLDSAVRSARATATGHEGCLRIALGGACPPAFLADLVSRYAAMRPKVSLEFIEGARSSFPQQLRSRELDVVLSFDLTRWIDVEDETLWAERLYAAVPRSHRLADAGTVTWVDLQAEQLIFSARAPGPPIFDFLASRIPGDAWQANLHLQDVGFARLLDLVAAQLGVTVVPASIAAIGRAGVVFRRIAGGDALLELHAVWLAENDNPRMRQFVNVMRSVARAYEQRTGAAEVSQAGLTAPDHPSAEPSRTPGPPP